MSYEKLFSPIKIGSVELKNRVVMAPMHIGLGQFNGCPTDKMMDYYEERAKGGVGLIITEITRVEDINGASTFAQLSMSQDINAEALRPMAERIHKHGAKLFVQLHHAGRQNLGLLVGTTPLNILLDKTLPNYAELLYKIVPAGKLLLDKHIVPPVAAPSKCEKSYMVESAMRAMSKKEVQKLIGCFVKAAERVKAGGADGVELHASHGYLIQQFLSPNTNRRTDEYGGNLENRMRFLVEILQGIKFKCGKDFPVIVRLSVDECYSYIGQKGKGYDLSEGVEMAKRLEEAGADAIDVSSAAYDTFNYWLEPTSFECGWRAYMAKAVKEAVKLPVLAANLIRSAEQAEKQLENGVQDLISLGRPMLADPHWVEKVQNGNEDQISRCICCLYCIQSMMDNAYEGGHAECSVNPFIGKEALQLPKDGNGRKIAVIGAGPAGLMCSRLLAERGFSVKLFEKAEEAGGQLILAAAPPHKEKIKWCIEDMVSRAKGAGVELALGAEATNDILKEYAPHALVFATGASPVKPRSIKGIDLENVYTSTDILSGRVKLEGKKAAVIGSGMTGLETAEKLCSDNKVTVVEMADTVAPGTWMQHIDDAIPRLEANGTRFMTGQRLVEFDGSCIITESTKNSNKTYTMCDALVLAMGIRSENALYLECRNNFSNVYVIGDASKGGRIADATASALEVAAKIK